MRCSADPVDRADMDDLVVELGVDGDVVGKGYKNTILFTIYYNLRIKHLGTN